MTHKMATTQWSQVLAARDGTETESRRALERLCAAYWEPLYAFVRRQGSGADEAADLTQAYFATLLEKRFVDDVDPSKGRFRSFLLASLRHFLSNERDRERTLKAGGRVEKLSLDIEGAETRYGVHADREMTPDEAFEVRWAVAMLNRALVRLRELSIESGAEDQFETLKPYLTGEGEQSYREVASRLGTSEGAVKMAVVRLRKRLGQCLRAEVAETVADPSEIDDEVRQIVSRVRL